jgi:PAS domain-containing protein
MIGVNIDITDRKLAEQKIGEQAALIDIATDAIFVRDLENRILFWNRGAENLYGWTAEESVGKLAHELLHVESLSQMEAGVKTTLEQGFWQGELEKTTKTGRKIIEHQPKISAVLLDMSMPNMDGLTAIRTLRTLNPNVKIIAVSGLPSDEQKAIAIGANKFLSKPYTATDLLNTLSDAIRIKK